MALGIIKEFEAEKLVVGLMYTDIEFFESGLNELCALYGEIDTQSREYSFSSFSNYYNEEMNGEVLKRFVSFKTLINPSMLADAKLNTNHIESIFTIANCRKVNIDPCLLSHGKFVMATTKGASFRIPLCDGVYGDLSLVYARNHWVDFFWTYYDIKSEPIKQYLAQVRKLYLLQRKA